MLMFEFSQGKGEKGSKRASREIPIFKGQAGGEEYYSIKKNKTDFLFKYGQAA